MTKKKIIFSFRKLNDLCTIISYEAYLENGELFKSGDKVVTFADPVSTISQLKSKVNKAMWNLATRNFRWRGGVDMVRKNSFIEKTKVEGLKPVLPTLSANKALYEVKKIDGYWTIIKHQEPLYTQEQAKTILFQRIVNA